MSNVFVMIEVLKFMKISFWKNGKLITKKVKWLYSFLFSHNIIQYYYNGECYINLWQI